MKHFFLLLLFFSFFAASGQTAADTAGLHNTLRTAAFGVSGKVTEIDDWLFIRFPEWEKMADPKKRFNPTDNGGGAKRRLFFAARSGNVWIVSYEHGGRGYHTHCFIITVTEGHELFVFDCHREFKSMDELRADVLCRDLPLKVSETYDY